MYAPIFVSATVVISAEVLVMLPKIRMNFIPPVRLCLPPESRAALLLSRFAQSDLHSSASDELPAAKIAPLLASFSIKPSSLISTATGKPFYRHTRFHAGGQHHEIVQCAVAVITLGVDAVKYYVLIFVLRDAGNLRLDELHVRIGLNFLVEIVEPVDGADVDVIHRCFEIVAEFLAQKRCLFERRHAANVRAVFQMIFVARTGALNKGNVLDFFAIGRTNQLAASRTSHAFELNIGHHILVTLVTVGMNFLCVVGLPARRPNYRARFELHDFFIHVQVDCVELARGLGFFAIGSTDYVRVQQITLRIRHRAISGRRLCVASCRN